MGLPFLLPATLAVNQHPSLYDMGIFLDLGE
jgi:hypothetical protein